MDKQTIRETVWDRLSEDGIARFPFPPHGRIPNFDGADVAAEVVCHRHEWQQASVIKCNPDSPQRPIREQALVAGKLVYMAVPRLRDERCFLRLDPDEIDDHGRAATLSGSEEYGEAVLPDALEPIDLIVTGSVAVSRRGDRIGKGEGFSDLEYAILIELGLVDSTTPIMTTVHSSQIVDIPFERKEHDIRLDLVGTPDTVIEITEPKPKHPGIMWELLSDDACKQMPILARFHRNNEL